MKNDAIKLNIATFQYLNVSSVILNKSHTHTKHIFVFMLEILFFSILLNLIKIKPPHNLSNPSFIPGPVEMAFFFLFHNKNEEVKNTVCQH